MNQQKPKVDRGLLEQIQELALDFMQSASATRDIESNSLNDFLGRLRWEVETREAREKIKTIIDK